MRRWRPVIPEEKPEIKPEPEKKPEPKKEPDEEKPKKKPVRKKAGDAGKQVETVTKGQADGVESCVAATASTGKKGKVAQEFGNAAESNYKGKVRSKVQRHFRYPKSADRAGLGGTVTVSFTVSASGGVSSVRIVKGSGSPVLDDAAVSAVEKGGTISPKFPRPPIAAAGLLSSRSSSAVSAMQARFAWSITGLQPHQECCGETSHR